MKEVHIYSKANCGGCNAAKMFMQAQGIDYTEHRIDLDESAMNHLVEKNISSVPFIEIGDTEITGFNASKILEALRQ